MARTTVRIPIPRTSPDDLITLLTKVQKKHTEDGDKSPLGSINMEMFANRLAAASQKREEAATLEAQAQALNAEAAAILGIAPGQSSKTPDTLYFDLCRARDLLSVVHRGNENRLQTWGFNVITGTATAPRKPAKGSSPNSAAEG